MKREDIVFNLDKKNLIGVELGVASGCFSKKLVETDLFDIFYCIDKWNDHHSIKEYFGVQRYFKKKPERKCIESFFSRSY